MVIHTETCQYCDDQFAYDAPANPSVTPEYCSERCKWTAGVRE